MVVVVLNPKRRPLIFIRYCFFSSLDVSTNINWNIKSAKVDFQFLAEADPGFSWGGGELKVGFCQNFPKIPVLETMDWFRPQCWRKKYRSSIDMDLSWIPCNVDILCLSNYRNATASLLRKGNRLVFKSFASLEKMQRQEIWVLQLLWDIEKRLSQEILGIGCSFVRFSSLIHFIKFNWIHPDSTPPIHLDSSRFPTTNSSGFIQIPHHQFHLDSSRSPTTNSSGFIQIPHHQFI